MSHKSFVGILVIRLQPVFLHKSFYDSQYLLVFFHSQKAVIISNDIMGPSGIKSRNNLPIFIPPKWELGFIAVPPGILHSHNRKHLNLIPFELPNPH